MKHIIKKKKKIYKIMGGLNLTGHKNDDKHSLIKLNKTKRNRKS